MNARASRNLFSGLVAIAVLASPHTATAQSNLARCRGEIAGAVLDGMLQQEKAFAGCMKSDQTCEWTFQGNFAGDALSLAVQGVDSACVAATVIDDVAAGDLALPACPMAWRGCEDPSLASLYSVDNCETCLSIGLDTKAAFDLDLSFYELAVSPPTQRKCVVKVYRALSRAARRGLDDARRCALDAGEPPWSCTTDPQPESKLSRMLTRIDRAALRCEGALAEPDSVVATLCNGPVSSTSDLAECARSAAVCRACQAANFTLGLEQDCVAQSGDRLCSEDVGPDFGRPDIGSLFVTNRDDGTITLFDYDLAYTNGSLAASTFPVGSGPVDVAINPRLGLAYVVNRTDATLSILVARTGQPAFGDLASSTFAVGSMPSAVAVHQGYGIVFVANEADGTVTLLDGNDGSYVNGTLAASSLPTGRGPSSVAVDEINDIVYVANADDDTVTFLRAQDGKPYFADLASSTFPVGDEPTDVFYFITSGLLFVTNHGDGTVTTLDAVTGAPKYGTLPASTRIVGTGPVASVYEWSGVYTALDEGNGISGWVDYLHETAYGPISSDSVSADGPISDLLLDSYGRLLATSQSTDELGESYVQTYHSLLGVTAVEDATVTVNGYSALDLTVDPVSGAFLLPGDFSAPAEGAIGVLDPTSKTATFRGSMTEGDMIAYNPAADIAFVVPRYDRDIVMLQGATGAYLNGTLAASTLYSVCDDWIDAIEYAPVSDTLFVRCYGEIVYLNGTTGAFRTGLKSTSTVSLSRWGYRIAVDEAADRVFVTDTDFSSTFVVALTVSAVGYANGTYAASQIISDTSGRGIAVSTATGTLYRGNSNGQVTLWDYSGTFLGTAALPADSVDNIELTVNPANGLLYVSRTNVSRPGIDIRVDDVVYLHASDGSYANTSLEDSSVIVGEDRGVLAARISQATSTIGIAVRSWPVYGVLLLDADEPLPKGEKKAFRRTVPTGAAPSAIATMPYYY